MTLFKSFSSQNKTRPSSITCTISVIMLLSKFSLWHCVRLENSPDEMDLIPLSCKDISNTWIGIFTGVLILLPSRCTFLRDTNSTHNSSASLEILFRFNHRSTMLCRGSNALGSITLMSLFESLSS